MNRTALIVDDNQLELTLLCSILSEEYDVIPVKSGSDALDALKKHAPNVSAVLLDIIMPGMDGFELLRRIKEDSAFSGIPVIVTTSLTDEQSQLKALTLGANGYAFKPYNRELLLNLVRNAVELHEKSAYENASRRDWLTGLLNRETFFNSAERLISTHEPGYYVLACLDIENFKFVNAQYGTQKGDMVLKHVAWCIDNFMEGISGLTCRFTADRFAVLYPAGALDREDLKKRHKNLVAPKCIRTPIRVRIGTYRIYDTALGVSDMFDRAMLAQESIKGRYDTFITEYTEEMRAHLLHEQKIVNAMEGALDAGEFEVWYQPQYNHATGALIGAEALVRWRRGGMIVPPDEFVPTFEKNGFIYRVDKFVWDHVCKRLRALIDGGEKPLPVSVNISRYDLFQPDFFDTLNGLKKLYDIPEDMLRLEITESAFSSSEKTVINAVKKLISQGFTVEIDDFGSGYSSLNTLKDVPASILKLDMKFFENTGDSQRGGNIVEAVVRMAKMLGMAVIAEGVEDAVQADYLKSIGCYYIQGYCYSKPLPESEYEALLSTDNREVQLKRLKTIKTLDSNEFWNPRSMETLIFNSYVGGACIFEYYKGKSSLLRINEQYVRELNGLVPAGALLEEASIVRFLDGKERKVIKKTIDTAINSHKEATCELRLCKDAHVEYLRLTLRAIARTDEHYLFYAVTVNVTERRELADQLSAVLNNAGNGITAVMVDGNKTELLFSNDRFYEIVGYSREDYRRITRKDMLKTIHPDDREAVRSELKRGIANSAKTTLEYRVVRGDGTSVYVNTVITFTHFTGVKLPVQIAVFSDVTANKLASEQLEFLNGCAHDMLAQSDISLAIDKALDKLRTYFGSDRAYVVEIDYDKRIAVNTYERCAPGVESEAEKLQSVPLEQCSHWIEELEQNRLVAIKDVNELDADKPVGKQIAMQQGIRSLMLAPMLRDGALVGFVGVDDPRVAMDQLERLRALGDYIAVLLTRRDLSAKIDSDREMMNALMNDTPGGFVRMRLTDEGVFVPVYANDGFLELTGLTHEQLKSIYSKNVLDGVHPEDRDIVSRAGEEMLRDGKAKSARFRVKNGAGEYIWLTLNGRITRDATGTVYLNVYYADVTKQVDEEYRQKELLDNLPCGAALYEYDGSSLSVIHINKSYWSLVGREPTDYRSTSILNAVHPDDRAAVHNEIETAIREKRNVDVNVRILTGDAQYAPFCINASFTRRQDGTYVFYAAYTPIKDNAMSMQDMLPIALSTMMSVSEDHSYVKDKSLSYICCSKSFCDMLGFKRMDEIVGKTDFDLFDKDVAESFISYDRRVIETGESMINYVETVLGPDGILHTMCTSKYPITDASGNVTGLYGVSRDVTAEREKESQLELVTSSIPGGLASYNITQDGVSVRYFNDGFYKFSGYTREEYERTVKRDPLAFVHEDDKPVIREMIADFQHHHMADGHVNGCVYRRRTKEGGFRWISMKTVLSRVSENSYIVNVVQLDITEQQEEKERLRVSEEFNRIAIEQSGNIITRFDVQSRTLTLPDSFNPIFVLPHVLNNMPHEQIKLGRVSPDTADAYTELFEDIIGGSASGSATYKQNSTKGWRWLEAQYTTVFSNEGKPVSAVISFTDITERLEKEVVYNKWQQSLSDRALESYTLFRCNMSKTSSFDSWEGKLLNIDFEDKAKTFDERTQEYAEKYVYQDDRAAYTAFLDSGMLLSGYYRGDRSKLTEYREMQQDGRLLWRRLSVDLVEHPSSHDVEVYLMYEDIDEQKRAELLTLERSERDPLTGVLNRATFIARFEEAINTSEKGAIHALMMLDVDNFKHVNDTLGHGVGDSVLIELTRKISGVLRRDDLIGRLGGDEFFVFVKGLPDSAAAERKAAQICALDIASNAEVQITVSVGVAMIPANGTEFDTLYRKADKALYAQKERGKAGYLFVQE